jgi:hypothetical protein
MKKALVVLLILAVAGGLFAQVKFTGEVKTGLGLVYDTAYKTAYLEAFGRDAEQPLQFRLNGAVTNEAGTAGAKFRVQQRFANATSEAAPAEYAGLTVPFAYGYLNAFGTLLTLQGGLVDDGTFNSGGGILDSDSGEGVGANALVKPIDNLVIGAGAYAAKDFGGIYTKGDEEKYSKSGDAKYTAGVSFTAPGLVKFVTSFRTKSDWESNQAILGINVLALSDLGLKLVLEGRFTDIGEDAKTSSPMDVDGFLTVGYTKAPLSLGLNAAFYKTGINKPSTSTIPDEPIIAFWLYGSYAVSESIIPRLDAVFMLNSYDDSTKTDGTQSKWHYKNFTKSAGKSSNKDQKLIAFRPAVLLKLDANNTFEIGDYVSIKMDKEPKFRDEKKSLISNVFYIDYVFKF